MKTEIAHQIHEKHVHVHGPDCGHGSMEHAGHVDYRAMVTGTALTTATTTSARPEFCELVPHDQ